MILAVLNYRAEENGQVPVAKAGRINRMLFSFDIQ